MTKINLDFSSSLSQIDQLKSAALGFNKVLQDILNTTAKFGNAINQATTGAMSANLSQGGNLPQIQVTPENVGELLSQVRERMQANQQAIQDFHRAHPNAIRLGAGRYKIVGTAGTFIKNLQPLYEEQKRLKQEKIQYQRAIQDFKMAEDQASLDKDIQSVAQFKKEFLPITGFGYDISALPSLISASQKLGNTETWGDLKRLSDTIKGLQESGNKNSQIAANVLKDIVNNLKTAQTEFQEALRAYDDPTTKDDPKRQIEAMDRLTKAMENLDRNIDQARQAERGARQLPGGGGDGGGERDGPSLFGIPLGRFIRGAGTVGAVLGGALGLVRFAQDVSIGLGRGVVGGEIDRFTIEGQMAERRFADITAANDFTRIENMMRFRGDVLTAHRSRFLGPEGFREARQLVSDRQALEVDLMKQERARDFTSNLIGAGARAGAGALGGLAVGGPIAALLGGAAGLLSSIPGFFSSYMQSPITQLEGLDQGVLGKAGQIAYGPGFKNLAIEKQQSLMAKLSLENYNQARALQDADMQRFRPLMAGYQEILNTIRVQQEGVSLVGAYAVRGREDIESGIPSAYKNAALQRQKEIERLEKIKKEKNEEYRLGFEEARKRSELKKEEFQEVAKNFSKSVNARETGDYFFKRNLEKASQSIAIPSPDAAIQADLTLRDYESSVLNYSNLAPLSTHARLEMSRADFQRYRNQLTNVLGRGLASTESQTARLIEMSRSGLGGFDQLLSNLVGLNRAVGGQDNIRNLERILENAIMAGFDKSRTAQMFTQTVTQLSEQTGITGVSSIAENLRVAAAGMSATGVADERSLGLAAKGFFDFSRYTAQVGGVSSILGTVSAFRSGIGFGQGAGILAGMGSPEIADAIRQIKAGNITNPKVAALRRISGLTDAQLLQSLQEIMFSKNAPIESLIQNTTGKNLSEIISRANSGNLEEFQRAMAIAMEAGSQMDLGVEGVMSYVSSLISQNATPEMLPKLNEQIRKSQQLFRDPAKQNLQAFIDSLTANAVVQDRFGADNLISDEERMTYTKAIEMGMSPLIIQSGKFRGREITKEAMQDPEFRKEADKELMKLSRFDIARMTQNAAALADSKIQEVRVVNVQDIGYFTAAAFRAQEPKRNLNDNG